MKGMAMSDTVVAKLAALLAANGRALCAWTAMYEPAIAELLAREGFDAVVLDLQHGALDFAGASRAILSVALAGKPAIARVPVAEFPLPSRLLPAPPPPILPPLTNFP